jgi:glycosyltransferase involved in cell wall biosynthesis
MKQSQALIVYELPGASQRYRAQHLREQLQICGVACRVAHLDQLSPALLSQNDVVVFQRVSWNRSLGQSLRRLRRERVVTVFDIDDLLFEPEVMRRGLAREVANLEWLSRVLAVRQTYLYRSMVQEVDAVLTTTEYLTEAAKKLNPSAFTHRNAFSQAMWAASEQAQAEAPRERQTLVIGYASGTASHDYDFRVVQPALRRLLADFPQAELRIIGPVQTGLEQGGVAGRVKRLPFVHWTQLPRLLAQFDINLAPLEVDNPFCQAKSEIKYLETALVRVPTIASPTQAFRHAIQTGRNGLLAADGEEWANALRLLAERPEDRQRLAENALVDAVSRYHPLVRSAELLRLLSPLCQERRGESLALVSHQPSGGGAARGDAEELPRTPARRKGLVSRLFQAFYNYDSLTLLLSSLLRVQRWGSIILARLDTIRRNSPLGSRPWRRDAVSQQARTR